VSNISEADVFQVIPGITLDFDPSTGPETSMQLSLPQVKYSTDEEEWSQGSKGALAYIQFKDTQ
jgi:hypothetical protein